MARSLKNYRQNLNESEQKLQEIGQLIKPYQNKFKFEEKGNSIFTRFNDDQTNQIRVFFHRFKTGVNSFEVEFDINNQGVEAFKTTTKHFFKIISTVIAVINQFIEEYQPIQLYIEGLDKKRKVGQKNNIWLQYAKVNIKDQGYAIGLTDNGFMLQNNKLINKK